MLSKANQSSSPICAPPRSPAGSPRRPDASRPRRSPRGSKILPTRLGRTPASASVARYRGDVGLVGVGRHLRGDVAGERGAGQWGQLERERVELGAEREVLALEVGRGAEEAQQVLLGEQVRHLLTGDRHDRVVPGRGASGRVGRHRRAGEAAVRQRVRGVEVLDQQRVLDLRGRVQEEHRPVPPAELGGLGMTSGAVRASSVPTGAGASSPERSRKRVCRVRVIAPPEGRGAGRRTVRPPGRPGRRPRRHCRRPAQVRPVRGPARRACR